MPEYYVSSTRGDDHASGTIDYPWRTIGIANDRLQEGDTVCIMDGTYPEQIFPKNPYTTYQVYGENISITGGNNRCAALIIHDGIRLLGLPIGAISREEATTYHGVFITNGASNIEVDGCLIRNGREDVFINEPGRGIEVCNGSSNIRLIANLVHHWGNKMIGGNDLGECIHTWDDVDNVLIEHNECFAGGHSCLDSFSNHTIIRKNKFHNEGWNKCISVYGIPTHRGILVEDNDIYDSGGWEGSDYANGGMQFAATEAIVRRNKIYNNFGTGLDIYNGNKYKSNNSLIEHNSCLYNGQAGGNGWFGWGISVTENPSDPDFHGMVFKKNGLSGNMRDGIGFRDFADINDHTIMEDGMATKDEILQKIDNLIILANEIRDNVNGLTPTNQEVLDAIEVKIIELQGVVDSFK